MKFSALWISFFVTFSSGLFWLFTSSVCAADTPTVQFEITAPTTAKVNEAIDITVRAIDKDKKTTANYRGSIIFVPTNNFWDVIPMQWKAIPFTNEDNWQKIFSKGIIFKSPGKQKIYITDISEDITGEAVVDVTASETTWTSTQESVTIITPENNSKITTNSVIVSGKTRKNSKVLLTLNGKDAGNALSDEEGLFNKTLSNIDQEKNILSVSVIDGNNAVIGKSSDVTFEKSGEEISLNNVTISPANSVTWGDPITINVEATAWLPTVNLTLDKSTLQAKEKTAGNYVLETIAPSLSWVYTIKVDMTDNFWKTLAKDAPVALTVIDKVVPPKIAAFKNTKVTTNEKRVVFNFSVENLPTDIEKFKIVYGETEANLNKEVITYATGKIINKDGIFQWYIDWLESKKYFFKIYAIKADGTMFQDLNSELLNATIGTLSCTIGNVWTVSVATNQVASVLSWPSLTGAISYNIYKLTASGYILFQNTKENTLTLYLSSGSVTHDDFAIKALCDQKTESADYAKVSKVQTGPKLLTFLIILSAIMSAVIIRRKSLS
jgi:hypothetical protein